MNTTFSKNLKKLRLQKKLTQEQAAEVLGVSTQTISRWECNTTLPDVMLLPEIARLYCVTVDDLFKEDSSAYENYAQRLASVYEITHKPEDYLKADMEFQKLKKTDNYTMEDCRIHGMIHTSMMCYCRQLAIKNFNLITNHFERENNADSDNKVYWQTRYQKMHYYVEIGQAEACLKNQTKRLKKHPDDYMEWTATIYACYCAGNYENAYEYFSRAKTKFPEKWEIYDIGSSVCKALKKYEEAIQCCDKSYELNAESLDAKYAKAFCYEEMGNYEKAYHIWMEIIQSLKENGYDVEVLREEKRAQACFEKMY